MLQGSSWRGGFPAGLCWKLQHSPRGEGEEMRGPRSLKQRKVRGSREEGQRLLLTAETKGVMERPWM